MDDQSNVFFQAGQGEQPGGTQARGPAHERLAVVSFACGMVGFVSLLAAQLWWPLIVLSLVFPAAIVCGHMALRRIRVNPHMRLGSGMARFGMVVGYFLLVLYAAALVIFVGALVG